MPQAISSDKTDIIVKMLGQGMSRTQIATLTGVSTRAITRISTNLRKHGDAKAPPSGLKVGRPNAMTREQAQGMLAWMQEKEYTFFVKDLVQHLRETSAYTGCHGTVGRTLIRAGFTRKQTWNRSGPTSWSPPTEFIDWTILVDAEAAEQHENKPHRIRKKRPDAISSHDESSPAPSTDMLKESVKPDLNLDGIDPALHEAISPLPAHEQHFGTASPTAAAAHALEHLSSSRPSASTARSRRQQSPPNPLLDPALRSSSPAQYQPASQLHPETDSSSDSAATHVQSLESQLAAQQELIMQLQKQLAAQNRQPQSAGIAAGALASLDTMPNSSRLTALAEQAAQSVRQAQEERV